MFMWVCLCKCLQVLQEARRGLRLLGAGVAGGCEPANVSAGNRTWVWKSSECSWPLTISPIPLHAFHFNFKRFMSLLFISFQSKAYCVLYQDTNKTFYSCFDTHFSYFYHHLLTVFLQLDWNIPWLLQSKALLSGWEPTCHSAGVGVRGQPWEVPSL